MREILLGCLSVLVALGIRGPQAKPDFSGKWVLDTVGDPPAGVARELIVVQTTKRLTSPRGASVDFTFLSMQRRDADGVRTDMYDTGITGGIVGADGSSTTYSVRWVGSTLFIGTSSSSGPPDDRRFTEHSEEWSLDADGRLQVVVEDRAPGRTTSTTSIYRRQR